MNFELFQEIFIILLVIYGRLIPIFSSRTTAIPEIILLYTTFIISAVSLAVGPILRPITIFNVIATSVIGYWIYWHWRNMYSLTTSSFHFNKFFQRKLEEQRSLN